MPKRNLERIREILFLAEGTGFPDGHDDNDSIFVDMQEDMILGDAYQLLLMQDAGWISGRGVNHGVFRITNSGHDYLDAIRDDGIWTKTKQAVADTGGSATLEIVKSLAIGYLKKKIENHTGIAL